MHSFVRAALRTLGCRAAPSAAKLYHGRSHFLELNERHAGQTVFVLGSGPQLAAITRSQRRKLESRISIAVNKVFYLVKPTYFLSAYIGEVMLAARRIPDSTLLHMRRVYEPPLIPGILPLKRDMFSEQLGLPPRFVEPEPVLFTKFNVALAATHLAFILGAARIVYVGVEQRDQLHFYNFDERIRRRIRADIISRGDPPILCIDHPYSSMANALAAIDRPMDDCRRPFARDHRPTFAEYFRILRGNGVDVIATERESIVADADARVLSLDAALDAALDDAC